MMNSLQVSVGLVLLMLQSTLARPPKLTTTNGRARGIREDAGDNLSVDIFYGIPFAQPPVDDLRFKAPQPLSEPWNGTLDATKPPNSCWQILDTAYDRFRGVEMWNPNTQLSEDCLYLNVYRPNNGNRKPKPILVWIFGGGFFGGTSTLDVYNATQLAARNDVIVVTIGYRLGILGFLHLGTSDAPGNQGLLDQAMALQWVKDNAKNLGGDESDISIFGESAGAVSVGFHLLSPLTRNIINNAIMESASPLCGWAVQEKTVAKSRGRQVAKGLSCNTDNDAEVLACLKAADPDKLSAEQWNVVDKYVDMTLGPVVDGNFLPDDPVKMVARGDIKITNVLTGVNKNEGIFFDVNGFKEAFPLDGNGEINRKQFQTILKGIVPYQDQIENVKAQYFKDTSLSYTGVIDAVSGDTLFKCPVIDFAQQYTALGGRVYLYSFEHRLRDMPWPKWMGVPHGYEIEVIFGLPMAAGSNYTENEKELSRQVMGFWTRFAATGNPNSAGSDEWPEYTEPEEKYLVIKGDGFQVNRKLRHEECAFWDKVGMR